MTVQVVSNWSESEALQKGPLFLSDATELFWHLFPQESLTYINLQKLKIDADPRTPSHDHLPLHRGLLSSGGTCTSLFLLSCRASPFPYQNPDCVCVGKRLPKRATTPNWYLQSTQAFPLTTKQELPPTLRGAEKQRGSKPRRDEGAHAYSPLPPRASCVSQGLMA